MGGLVPKAIEQTMRLDDKAVTAPKAARALREQAIEDLLKRPARLWDEELLTCMPPTIMLRL